MTNKWGISIDREAWSLIFRWSLLSRPISSLPAMHCKWAIDSVSYIYSVLSIIFFEENFNGTAVIDYRTIMNGITSFFSQKIIVHFQFSTTQSHPNSRTGRFVYFFYFRDIYFPLKFDSCCIFLTTAASSELISKIRRPYPWISSPSPWFLAGSLVAGRREKRTSIREQGHTEEWRDWGRWLGFVRTIGAGLFLNSFSFLEFWRHYLWKICPNEKRCTCDNKYRCKDIE